MNTKSLLLSCLISATGFAQNYFQQEVNYKIDVQLDDKKHEIRAFEEIEYHNNSNQDLDTLYFHLWPNAYKHENTVMAKQILKNGQVNFHYAEEKDRGFIHELDFKVDGKSVSWNYWNEHDDVAVIILNKPIKPHSKVIISTPFHVKIPKGVYSRLGHLDESYQMTQWYPKPAVFDNEGWHPMYYLSQGEFYSEYGSFDVSITLPRNYVVGATGDLQNEEEKLWLDSLARIGAEKYANYKTEEQKTNGVKISIGGSGENTSNVDISFPESSNKLKTIRFVQDRVHDFAWFADKRFNVLKGEVELPNTGEKVETWAMFTNRHEDLWKDAIEYLNDGLYYYSLWNGDYPYKQCTAVDGALTAGGGMEYPNVTVIGSVGSARSLETVIVHEVGHNWFYGILGSNERRFPWMDEGINSFNEYRYFKTKYPNEYMAPQPITNGKLGKWIGLDEYKHREENYLQYLLNAREGFDQPCGHHSEDFTSINYGLMVYTKTALAFEYLQAYLGEDELDNAMKEYYEQWKFKHPQPDNIKSALEQSTNKDLSWFFNDLIATNKKIDYAITKVKHTDKHSEITLKNKGDINGPVSVSGILSDSISTTLWVDGFDKSSTLKLPGSGYDQFVIDASHKIPEINRQNNFYTPRSIFSKIEPIDLDFIWALEKPSKTQIFISPYISGNYNDKIILGLSFHNKQILKQPFAFSITPAYSTGEKTIVGKSQLKYTYLPHSKLFRSIQIKSTAEKFHYDESKAYTKTGGEIRIDFKKNPGNSPHAHQLNLRTNSVSLEDGINYQISDISHSYKFKHTLKSISLNSKLEYSDEFTKLSFENRYSFKTEKRGTYNLRLFAGYFISEPDDNRFNFGLVQQNDYLFELGVIDQSKRNDFFNRQTTRTDGGFITGDKYTSDKWILSSNLEIPIRKKIKAYGNFGMLNYQSSTRHLWDAGIMLSVIPKRLEVYFPLHLTDVDIFDSYKSFIRFRVNIKLDDIANELRSSI